MSSDEGNRWESSLYPFPIVGNAEGVLIYTEALATPHELSMAMDGGTGKVLGEPKLDGFPMSDNASFGNGGAMHLELSHHLFFVCGAPVQSVLRASVPVR